MQEAKVFSIDPRPIAAKEHELIKMFYQAQKEKDTAKGVEMMGNWMSAMNAHLRQNLKYY